MDNLASPELFEKSSYSWICKISDIKAKYEKDSCKKSPIFPQTERKYKWQIYFYPSGNDKCANMSLILWSSSEVLNNIFAKYTFRLQNSNDEILLEKEANVSFSKRRSKAWGYLDVLDEERLLSSVHDDNIKFQVFILAKVMTFESYHTFIPPLKLSEDFRSIFKSGELSDFTFKLNDGSVICGHRAILTARSPVFRGMFKHATSESELGETTITDIDKDTMSILLEFMYTGVLRNVSEEETRKLLPAADKYELLELKQLCEEILVDELNASNALDILVLAELHNVPELKHSAVDYIKENASKFSDVSKYKELKKYPDLLIELLAEMAKLSVD